MFQPIAIPQPETSYILYNCPSEDSLSISVPAKNLSSAFSDSTIQCTNNYKNNGDIAIYSLITRLSTLTAEDFLPSNDTTWYLDEIAKTKYSPWYNSLLSKIKSAPFVVQYAFLSFLSDQSYNEVNPYEEQLTFSVLKSNDVILQERALNVLLSWGNFSNKQALVGIKIKNKFLNKIFMDFINA